MIFNAYADGTFALDGGLVRCALGRTGVVDAARKREGDGASPLGTWPMRRLLYRADRGGHPLTGLPAQAIHQSDGWCDAPGDPAYNRMVTLPYPASAEHLWLEDHVYDLIVVLGHNDDPPVAGLGSAIFLHLARPDFAPTAGCVALARPDLERVLTRARPGDAVAILASAGQS